jgi:hypothetical protein
MYLSILTVQKERGVVIPYLFFFYGAMVYVGGSCVYSIMDWMYGNESICQQKEVHYGCI